MVFMPRPYPKEFREGALQLVREGERPVAQIAHDLGIAESCLRRWIKQAELDTGQREDGLSTNEREELRRLRRENARLKQEKEILRKAAAFFAREEIR
jgi:transposase